jgi:hypothetical protein
VADAIKVKIFLSSPREAQVIRHGVKSVIKSINENG